ncbi:membrane hypothetical protein [uncultured Gammaproteobacteria bacterium]
MPLMMPLVAVMGAGPFLAWKRADLVGVSGRLFGVVGLTALVVVIALWLRKGEGPALALAGLGLAGWAVFSALADLGERIGFGRGSLADSLRRAGGLPRSTWGTAFAHAGLGVAIAGMTGSGAWVSERIVSMKPGETLTLSGYELAFKGVEPVQGPNYLAKRGSFELRSDGRLIGILTPEQRKYPVTGMDLTHSAIHTTGLADVYVALGEAGEQGAWTVRAYHHPLVPWLWLGCGLMVIGGLLSLSDRRLRVGAPARHRRPHPNPSPNPPPHAREGGIRTSP